MKGRLSSGYFLVVVAALIVGVGIDRVVVRASVARPSDISTQSSVSSTATPARAVSIDANATKPDPTPAVEKAPDKKSLAAILAERDPRQRTNDLENYINGLGPADYADALKRIRRIPGTNERDLASRLLVARWVQTDPEAALNFASSNRGFEYVADDVFEAEAATDVQAALARAQALQSPDLRYLALRGVLSFMADTNPAAALQLAGTFGDFPGQESLSSVIYRQWATNDPQAAALQAMQDQSSDNPWRSPVNQVARTWANQDPMAAANWSIGLTDPQAQAHSISQVMREWAQEDITAAANWVGSLPPGSSYDAAAAALAFSMAMNDPQSAVSWADNISDPTARNNALQRLSREVMWHDPTNGASVLQAAGVPANLIPPAPPPRGQRGR